MHTQIPGYALKLLHLHLHPARRSAKAAYSPSSEIDDAVPLPMSSRAAMQLEEQIARAEPVELEEVDGCTLVT